ncbi:S-layer homology domain-containing protein, partial [Patescibacteria group bacterium]|nr:S-layer homology domain-containing protein [Patescibacteria group bacterium]
HLEEGQEVCQGLKLGEIGSTGNSTGPHLHFQFEICGTSQSIPIAFTDGNGVPKCEKYTDIYNSYGNYTALLLNNGYRESCDRRSTDPYNGGELPKGGWVYGGDRGLDRCPFKPACEREKGHVFADVYEMDILTAKAAAYLYGECAVDGRQNNKFEPRANITKAEALKIPMYLFGILDQCKYTLGENFADVSADDWFYAVTVCALEKDIVSVADFFYPNSDVSFVQASKMVVGSAAKAQALALKVPEYGHFENISRDHWAYKYVETLYYYGAISENQLSYDPDISITRGEFALMVAKMSSCFCENVVCADGYYCDQKNYACSSLNPDTSTDIGGGDDPVDGDEPVCEPMHCGQLEVECGNHDDGCGGIAYCGGCGGLDYCDEQGLCQNVPCDPLTCEELNYQCGAHSDHCGSVLICGDCEDENAVCSAGRCVIPPCEPASCEQLGLECGVTGDGCADSLDCGTCLEGSSCENGHCELIPVCVPQTCAELSTECGYRYNGCGIDLHCGTCPSDKYCDGGHCKNVPCNPHTCGDLGVECGSASDGCGELLSCGGCADGSDCQSGSCVEIPVCDPLNCYQLGYQCGVHDNGCGDPVNCGTCGQNLCGDDGLCIADSNPDPPDEKCELCPDYAECVGGMCDMGDWICDPGEGYPFRIWGEGARMELAMSDGPNLYLNMWLPVEGGVDVVFDCRDLPAAALIHGRPNSSIYIMIPEYSDVPDFADWFPWGNELTIDPWGNDYNVYRAGSTGWIDDSEWQILFRFPAP